MADRNEDLNDPEESQRLAFEGAQAQIWTALPGIVADVDLAAQTVSVQPAIQAQAMNELNVFENVNLPLLVDVPICWPRAGGFALTFPVAVGDEVLVVFASRCIDAWWQSGGIGAQAELRMHDLSDGFAILAPTSQPKRLANVQTDGMELRTESRNVFIKLTDSTVFIKGNIVHEGDTMQTGDHTSTGTITGQTNVVFGGKSGISHTHSGVQTGGDNSGPPN